MQTDRERDRPTDRLDMETGRHAEMQTCRHPDMQCACLHASLHTYIRTYVHTYVHANGDTTGVQVIIPMYSQSISSNQGAHEIIALWLKTPYCRTPRKRKPWPKLRTDQRRQTSIHYKPDIYRRKSPIHRLSAVGLPRSLRAGSRGTYRWLNRTAAITHFLSLDMPPHQLPARSQILHRVSILVEARPQN